MVAIEKLLLNALQNLAVGYKMVHLMHAATIVFILMMLSMLIVEIPSCWQRSTTIHIRPMW